MFSLTSAAALFASLAQNEAKFSILFGCVEGQPQAKWFPEVEEAVSEKFMFFAASHRNDEDRQA